MEVRSDEANDVPTVAEGPAHSVGDGLESQIILGRARQRLLGWEEQPVRVGRYRVLERIGQGGMGVVFAAHDEELDRVVALKILRGELGPGTVGRQRLIREAQATAKLSHPNVVHVFEVGQQGDQVYMAMTLVRGETLRTWQAKRSLGEIVAMYRQAGEGLVAAHAEGIVHRDFKPDNVLVGSEGRPQIVDFGLARPSASLEEADAEAAHISGSGQAWRNLDITATGTVLGTPAYMAPEQLARGKPDARSDQFSFCVALFEALHRRRPFAGSSFTELSDNVASGTMVSIDNHGRVPQALHDVVLRGLARDPADRHPDMRALLDALEHAARPTQRRRRAAMLAGGALVAGAIAVVASQPGDATAVSPAIEAPAEPDPWADILAASDLPDTIATAAPDDPAAVTVQRLRNGLSIYVAHRPLEPAVSVVLAIRAGPTEEGLDQPGLSMLVQNAVISGTDRIGVIDADRERPLRVFEHAIIESLPSIDDPKAREAALASVAASERAGIELTVLGELGLASRSMGGDRMTLFGGDGAQFAARLPINRVGTWLGLAAEYVQRPVFRGFLSRTSDQLAMMTMFDSGDAPSRERDALLAPATGVHDGGLATLEFLASVPLAAAKRFHAQWYRPNNAALIFVGDITPEHARQIAEESFGSWEPALLPIATPIDAPLPERTLLEISAPGNVGAELVWPMPVPSTPEHASLEMLATVLGGRSGLLHVAGAGRAQAFGVHIGEAREFKILAMPKPEQSTADAERAAMELLRDIAEDRVDDEVWAAALTDSELDRLAWARGPSSLMHVIMQSYYSRESWVETRARMTGGPPTRAAMVAATKLLLSRGRIAIHQKPGELAPRPAPTLPESSSTWSSTAKSELVRAAIASPVPPMEPRFLVAGSSYTEHRHGAGRVITTDVEGPLFHMSWIFPIGTEEDPWACDAVRASLLYADVPGTRMDVYCTSADTRVDVVGVAARFAEIMPKLHRDVLARDAKMDVDKHVDLVVRQRGMHVPEPYLRTEAAQLWALLGDAAVDAKLPPTRTLKAEAAKRLPIARAALAEYDADVLYVGPDPDALLAALPPATGRGSPGPELYRPRVLDPASPRVFVMDDPAHRGVSVRALLPWIAETPREQLAAMMHRDTVASIELEAPFPIDEEHFGYDALWRPGAPIAVGVAFRVAPADTVRALEAASAVLRERPSPGAFADARRVLEAGFRAHRPVPVRVPHLVHAWPAASTDPRVAQWLALPSLTHDDLVAYYERVDATAPVLLVVGDVREIDLAALAKVGTIERGDAETIMLDPSQAFRRDTAEMLDE